MTLTALPVWQPTCHPRAPQVWPHARNSWWNPAVSITGALQMDVPLLYSDRRLRGANPSPALGVVSSWSWVGVCCVGFALQVLACTYTPLRLTSSVQSDVASTDSQGDRHGTDGEVPGDSGSDSRWDTDGIQGHTDGSIAPDGGDTANTGAGDSPSDSDCCSWSDGVNRTDSDLGDPILAGDWGLCGACTVAETVYCGPLCNNCCETGSCNLAADCR